jgi:casein kinase II subunit alpha
MLRTANRIGSALKSVARSSTVSRTALAAAHPQSLVPARGIDAGHVFGLGSYMQPSVNKASVARVYADVNTESNRELWDYDAFVPSWGGQEDYEIVSKLGRGKYSEVFAGIHLPTDDPVVIKILKPVKQRKVHREVLILQRLAGARNVTQLREVVQDPVSKTCSLVLDYADGADFKTLYPTLKDAEVRHYLFQLLRGLECAHSRGVMHRDIKPHNVMIDPKRKSLNIVDWGLAEFYHKGYEYNIRVASRFFKGPELLVNMKDYDYSLDMWSFGCVMAEMVFLVHPLFQGKDNDDQLVKITKVLGTDALRQYLEKYRVKLEPRLEQLIGEYPGRPLQRLVNDLNRHVATPEAIDLISRVLVMDHQDRLTAAEAMAHPYFDAVRAAAAEEDAATAAARVSADMARERADDVAAAEATAAAAAELTKG